MKCHLLQILNHAFHWLLVIQFWSKDSLFHFRRYLITVLRMLITPKKRRRERENQLIIWRKQFIKFSQLVLDIIYYWIQTISHTILEAVEITAGFGMECLIKSMFLIWKSITSHVQPTIWVNYSTQLLEPRELILQKWCFITLLLYICFLEATWQMCGNAVSLFHFFMTFPTLPLTWPKWCQTQQLWR